MIPKIVHSCWFGGRPRTKLAEKCIASWRSVLPDWELREWNEESFPIGEFRFAADAAKVGRWAVVSDVARFWCLEKFGGVYLDTDVELLAPIDDLISRGAFVSAEVAPHADDESLNPGSGVALAAGSALARYMLEAYRERPFESGCEVMGVIRTTLKEGLAAAARAGEELTIYPSEYFSPIQPDGTLRRTMNTRAIHWYAMSGYPFKARLARWLAWHRLGWVMKGLRRLRGRNG